MKCGRLRNRIGHEFYLLYPWDKMTFILATTDKETLPVDLLTGLGIVPVAGEETLSVAEAVCVGVWMRLYRGTSHGTAHGLQERKSIQPDRTDLTLFKTLGYQEQSCGPVLMVKNPA